MTILISSTTTAPATSQADPIHSQRSPISTHGDRSFLTGERGRTLDASDRAIGALETPIGPITVSSDGTSVVGLEWRTSLAGATAEPDAGRTAVGGGPGRAAAGGIFDGDHSTDVHADPILAEAIAQLRAYFAGRLGDFDIPVAFGPISDVAEAVLTTLSETVEAGSTITYGELAEASGTGIPARAVGGIMGLNPIPIIVPCHRVVAGDSLGGYSGGLPGHELETKRRLLEWEDALPQPLF